MIPAAFDYLRPGSLDEAIDALGAEAEAKVIAGGQSLLPLLRLRLVYPSLLVDVSRLEELSGVRDDGDAIVIGAATPHAVVLAHPLVAEHAPLIAAATKTVGDPAIRHRGTFGGSLAHADPAGDLPAVVRALDAELVVAGPSGRRVAAAADFFADYLQTSLADDELLVEVRVRKLAGDWGVRYEKFQRTAQQWAIVGVAAAVRRDDGHIAEARVALTNMGAIPVRAEAVESALVGARAEPGAIAEAAAHAADGTRPGSDIHAQADYRAHLARVLTARAVSAAAGVPAG
ncbi:MAG TPA: xanthine dehydrogenase family protein subunit M [Acidimicrobiales bacterium]|nr:xanthine dehydrogenase family protein subunit M [Acidimicrobiales bacterium]